MALIFIGFTSTKVCRIPYSTCKEYSAYAFAGYVYHEMKAAGFPIESMNTIAPKVSHGVVTRFEDVQKREIVFTWKPN